MSVEILLLAAIGISTPIIIQTGYSDMFTIPGAILAAVVAMLKATHEKRSWAEKGIVIVGTTMIGSTAPNAALHWWYPESIHKLIPHTYAILGFLSGLVGWLLFWAGYLLLDRRKEKVMNRAIREAEKRMGISNFSNDETSP